MTNTRYGFLSSFARWVTADLLLCSMTDVEIFERRYPVLLHEFSLREGSGGAGLYKSGDGVVRDIEFLQDIQASILSEVSLGLSSLLRPTELTELRSVAFTGLTVLLEESQLRLDSTSGSRGLARPTATGAARTTRIGAFLSLSSARFR